MDGTYTMKLRIKLLTKTTKSGNSYTLALQKVS